MTVNTIQRLKKLIDECKGTPVYVVSAWTYIHEKTNKRLYVAFTTNCMCDIFESPAVVRPTLIYRSGKFIGGYKYMNKLK